MRAPDFWWRPAPSLLAHILAPVGAVWGQIALRRMKQDGENASVQVICVGNPVAGGAGKTPAAMEIARLLIAAGKRPVFLTRGYGGRLGGPLRVVDTHDACDVGDEPLLLARTAPCVVARDRVAGAALAATLGDVIVMDDGFQNPSLHKDQSYLVVDSDVGLGNGLCIPAGPLRAPIEAQMSAYRGQQLLIVLGGGHRADEIARRYAPRLLRANLHAEETAAARLKGKRVLAFAGIGRPQKFADTLKEIGADVVRLVEFPDHHAFTAGDAEKLMRQAATENLMLVTTEKDHVRLRGEGLDALAKAAVTLPVRLVFEDSGQIEKLLKLGT